MLLLLKLILLTKIATPYNNMMNINKYFLVHIYCIPRIFPRIILRLLFREDLVSRLRETNDQKFCGGMLDIIQVLRRTRGYLLFDHYLNRPPLI
jgi:hypothetical protein